MFSTPLFALRCGHSLVELGDYKADIVDICGEPDSVESHYERRGNANHADSTQYGFDGRQIFPNNSLNYGQSHYAEIEVLVEEWCYDFGSERLRKVLRFENGRLKQIDGLGRRRH
jgi:Protein of unknown function (DUF2845)